MSRPTIPILEEMTNRKGYDIAVQQPKTIWHLTMRGELVVMRKDLRIANMGFKYIRSSWTSPASAKNCARKLNELFNTDDYGFAEITTK